MDASIDARLQESHLITAEVLGLKTMKRAGSLGALSLKKVRKEGGDYPRELYSYGKQLAEAGKLVSAERALRLAVGCSRRNPNQAASDVYTMYYLPVAISVLKDSKLTELEPYLSVFAPGTQSIFRSRISEKLGRISEALAFASDAIRILEPEGPSASLYEAYMGLAELHADTGQRSQAIQTGKAALRVAEDALAAVPYVERDSVRILIARCVEFLLPIMLKNAGPEDHWDAVNIAERAKARSILESLGEDWLPVAGDLPPGARFTEIEILSYVREIKRLTRHAAPVTRARNAELNEEEYRARLWSHLDTLPREFERYVRLRKGQPSPVADCIKTLGEPHPRTHTFIFYSYYGGLVRWWIDESAKLRDCALLPLGTAELEAKVSEFQRYCSTPGSDFRQKANDLYRNLFGSLVNELPDDANLLIVPSGPLFNVPFCALMDGNRFLISRFPVCTLPCVSLIQYWAIRESGPGRLVLGNSRGDLPAATEEAKAVARLLNAAPILEGYVLRAAIERQIGVCSFLHVACHATVDELVPGFSGLALADGTILSAQDLASAQLNCRLAFLSACNSGRAASRFEDDPLSIGVSLLHAGAQSVIFTLWQINDFVTRDLIVHFYQRMLKGFSLNRALRDAQLSLLKRKRYSHPFYWAAFQLVGDWAPCVAHKGQVHFG